ncbi:hypothetical protein GCM10010975_37680 [Comamonas phosphati]|nr:hypothetical protein GCM10010975_37680 [Comamonas phosphati]
MPVFIAALWGALLNIAGSLVGQVLISLGIAVVTYAGVDTTLDKLKSDAVTALMGLPPDLVALLSYLKVGVAISIITSAVAVRLTLSGMSGAIKRFRKQ